MEARGHNLREEFTSKQMICKLQIDLKTNYDLGIRLLQEKETQ